MQRAIRLGDGHELTGDVGMHFGADASAIVALGIGLSPRHQRQGYAIEAMNAVPGFVFDDLQKHRVVASVDPCNKTSIQLPEAVGMRREAHFRANLPVDNAWADGMVDAVLARQWSTRRAIERHRG